MILLNYIHKSDIKAQEHHNGTSLVTKCNRSSHFLAPTGGLNTYSQAIPQIQSKWTGSLNKAAAFSHHQQNKDTANTGSKTMLIIHACTTQIPCQG